ncbi:DUF1853 family protein [Vreelandella boliviensis]|uniref:DUF1853 domain-containing protein n=1 Tax=Vreelandella boliviensis LC1 TaxID=1072583 RepID=A0ABX4GB56_9GAMM|nr:DUF1853 family protein [Halomonas boliviensis]OZT74628.1 hypothetical protein CE457_08705 [Halomonas boliviensis LC1]
MLNESLHGVLEDEALGNTESVLNMEPVLDTVSALRDLAWLVATPDLVELPPPIPCGGRPTLKELGLESALLPWLRQLGRPQLAALNGSRATRMGHYHERLWHTLLDHAPNTRLLAQNVRITRKRNTLGELDMLYRTRDNPAPVHLEVAIKFYLGLPEGPGAANSQSRWIGPGGLDSLALKCSHLRRHQLPLSTTATALETLAHWLTPRDLGVSKASLSEQLTQRLAMPGVLYYPWHAEMPAPEGATADHRRGTWCYLRDWPKLVASLPVIPKMVWLEKPHWLATPPLSVFRPAEELLPAIIDRVQAWRSPQQVMLYCPEEEHYERLFLVPNDWPHQVPLPPAA